MVLEIGAVDLEAGQLRVEPPVQLSPTELRLFAYLAERPGEVIDKEQLLVDVWGYAPQSRSRTVYTTMDRLRRKLERDPAHPRHLITIGRSGYAFQPLVATAPPRQDALPMPSDAFVGRLGELQTLGPQLLQPRAVVTLHGPGGVGKTRLALELAELLRPQFPGGVHLCDLAEATTSEHVLAATAHALALMLPTGEELGRQRQRLSRAVGSRGPALLLFDNAEGCLGALAELVSAWPDSRPAMLVTTRLALGVDGELVHPVAPLSLDSQAGTPSEASALFIARARSLRPQWTPTPAELQAVDSLVDWLDGVPLAIELAARWSRVLSPTALWQRVVDDRLPLTAAADSPRPARHHSLEAAIRWSWDALPEAARGALARCAVFRGGFDSDAAEAVLGGPEGLMALETLVDAALVRRTPLGRWGLLQAIAKFAQERLTEAGSEGRVAERLHAAHYATLGGDEARAAQRSLDAEGMRAAAAELPNLRAAVARGEPIDAAWAALAASDLLLHSGPVLDAIPLLERALSQPLPDPVRARVLAAKGGVLRDQVDPKLVLAVLHEALALAESHAPECVGGILYSIGVCGLHQGVAEAARPHFEAALARHRLHGDRYGEALQLASLANIELISGRVDAAAEGYEAALPLLRSLGARRAEAIYLSNLGGAHLEAGRQEAALANMESALDLQRQLGSHTGEAQALLNLGLLHMQCGRPEAGISHYRQALAVARRCGELSVECNALANLAWVALDSGDTVGGRRDLDASDEVLAVLDHPLQRATNTLTRAWLHREEGDLARAERHIAAAHEIIVGGGYLGSLPGYHLEVGWLALARGQAAGALEALTRAEQALGDLGRGPFDDDSRGAARLRARLEG